VKRGSFLVAFFGLVAIAPAGACNSVLGIPEVGHLEAGTDPSGACTEGQKACDGGCVSVNEPATGCTAADCTPCAFDHASASCVQGACALDKCELSFADCDGKRENGCEVNLATDVKHCADCNNACPDRFTCNGTDCACTDDRSCGFGGTCNQGLCFCNQECGAGSPCDTDGTCQF
jgi:hypothetical protein